MFRETNNNKKDFKNKTRLRVRLSSRVPGPSFHPSTPKIQKHTVVPEYTQRTEAELTPIEAQTSTTFQHYQVS